MADFLIAYNRTKPFEGGYVNDPVDLGGETYKGIARKPNPKWEGWEIVDFHKSLANFPRNLESNQKLQDMIPGFYKKYYWDVFWGDRLNSQSIANEIYDQCVNLGANRAVKIAQRSAGLKETGRMSEDLLIYINNLA